MLSPRPHRTPTATRYGLLILLLAFAGMLLVACPTVDNTESDVSNYFVEAADDSRDAEGDGESIPSANIPPCRNRKNGFCRISPTPSPLLAQLATPPPSRAPPA